MDIKNFHLNTPMARKEYLKMPNKVIKENGLHNKATTTGYEYITVSKGMYWLLQAGTIAQQQSEERLGIEGYFQSKFAEPRKS